MAKAVRYSAEEIAAYEARQKREPAAAPERGAPGQAGAPVAVRFTPEQMAGLAEKAARKAARAAQRDASAFEAAVRREINDLGTDYHRGQAIAATKPVIDSRARGVRLAQQLRRAGQGGPAMVTRAAVRIGQVIEGPTPEREAKGDFELDRLQGDNRIDHVAVDLGHSAVARLAKSGKLDGDQVKAAEVYLRTWRRAHPDKGRCAWIDDRVSGGGGEADGEELRAGAAVKLAKARAAVTKAHPSALAVIDAIVIEGETASEAALKIGKSKSARAEGRALALLECGLFTLAVHWGVATA